MVNVTKQTVVSKFKVLSCHLPGGTEEKHKNLRIPVSGLRFEPGITLI